MESVEGGREGGVGGGSIFWNRCWLSQSVQYQLVSLAGWRRRMVSGSAGFVCLFLPQSSLFNVRIDRLIEEKIPEMKLLDKMKAFL